MGQGPAESLSLRRDGAVSGVVPTGRPEPEAAPAGWAAPEAALAERPAACRALLAGEPADRCPPSAEELLARRPLPADADVPRWSFPRRAGLPPRAERGRCEDCCAMIPSFLLVVDSIMSWGRGRAWMPRSVSIIWERWIRQVPSRTRARSASAALASYGAASTNSEPGAIRLRRHRQVETLWAPPPCRVFSAGCAAAACPFWRSGYD